MPGRPSDNGATAIVSFSPSFRDPSVHALNHGLKPPIFRVRVNWSQGNVLHVACIRRPENGSDGEGEAGGKVVEVRLGAADVAPERRRVAYGSVPSFALLQSRRNSMMAVSGASNSMIRGEILEHIFEYSNSISSLLGTRKLPSESVIEEPNMIIKHAEKPTTLKAAWQLMEAFYVDRHSLTWLPERMVDWLADYDALIATDETTIYSRLVHLQKKLVNLQVIEDDQEYWEGISSALSVGWLDVVVNLLRLHSSYQPDQLDNREIENGLVEVVAGLVSKMPRMRPDLPNGKYGKCYKTKPDFIKAWERWREQVTTLECSAFWVQCVHVQTREGLRKLLQIMLGSMNNLVAATCHWIELFVSHFLYIKPFIVGLEGFDSLAQKCRQLKPPSSYNGLVSLFIGILGENIEVVLAECSKTLGPWMVVHAMELLTGNSNYADILLHEERYNLGGISIEELHRLTYSQVLASHPLTWQIAPTYLASCPKQGLGLLENLLYKQPIKNLQAMLKNLEICRLYELDSMSANVKKIAGVYHWKHGRKGAGVYWLQQANDDIRLNRIAQQLFEYVGKSLSDESIKQWERLIELLGTQVGSASGLEFLHKYKDFRKSLKLVQNEKAADAARLAVDSLVQLMRNPSTPHRFWLPLLYDSVKLLNWNGPPLLSVANTHMLLNKLQELSMAKLHSDFSCADMTSQALASVRLALVKNLGRAILEEC